MRYFFYIFTFAVILSILPITNFAQKERSKKDLFKEISTLAQTKKPDDQRKAYDLGKEYVQRFGTETDDDTKYVKTYVEKYYKAARPFLFTEALDKGNFAEGFAIGKEILAEDPENVSVTMNLAYGGYEAFKNKSDKSYGAQAIDYATKTLAFFEAKKLPKEFAPFKDQTEATALMYYIIATFRLDADPQEAVKNYYKSLQYESSIKSAAYPYYVIAFSYEQAYQKAAADFQTNHSKKQTEDAAMKADNEKLTAILDRMIDAYARAVKLSENKNNPSAENWKSRLTEIYKFRNQSDKGLTELIDSVLTKPLPDPSSL